MKNLFLIIVFTVTVSTGCKKSGSSDTHPPPPCNFCILISHQWNLNKEVITTNAGDYTYTVDKLGNLYWKFFTFTSNLIYQDNEPNGGTYVYYDGTSNLN